MSLISKNNILNVDNYNQTFQDTVSTIFTKYMILLNSYLKQSLDDIFIQNKTYYIYVIKQGITILNNIFKILLLYTKNINIVYYNCQKAYIYYIEFIGQIGEDNHSFLQLNSKDAALFVYKKTIFDINHDIKKDLTTDVQSENIISELNLLIKIYNTILYKMIDTYKLNEVINLIHTDLHSIMNKIIKLQIDSNNNDNNYNDKINAIYIFSANFNKPDFLNYLDIFVKKIKKKNINFINLEQKILNYDIYNSHSPSKYIEFILTDM